jgi:hypothetical protein
MSFDLGEYLKSINSEKNNLTEGSFELNGYQSFIINRSMSYFPDTLGYAYNISKYSGNTPNSIHYLYYLESIPKRKRFSKWHKPQTSEMIPAIVFFYQVNEKRAYEYEKCLSDGEKDLLLKHYKNIQK